MLIRATLVVSPKELAIKLNEIIRKHDALVLTLTRPENIQDLIAEPCDILIISEENLPKPKIHSIEILRTVPDPPTLVVLTNNEDRGKHAAYLASGCEAVIFSRISPDMLCDAVEAILKKYISLQNEFLKTKRMIKEPRLSDFVSESPSMQAFMNLARKVVNTDSSILILGETGVGKERLALAIHGESRRRNAPFIAVNCAALPDQLLESELFGHEVGAFTGAVRNRRGAFEMAHKGTIFLDEIGDMPFHMQSKLLRVIQERQFQKLGGENMIKVDVRIMAATNKDLFSEVQKSTFRRDLYYRLSVVCLNLPPLSERREDIPELVKNYVDYLAPRIGVESKSINKHAMDALINYNWPGNVRELINVLERAMLLCETNAITLMDLPDEISGRHQGHQAKPGTSQEPPPSEQSSFFELTENIIALPWKAARQQIINFYEKAYLSALLEKNNGKLECVSREADFTTRALYQKMQLYGLDKNQFK